MPFRVLCARRPVRSVYAKRSRTGRSRSRQPGLRRLQNQCPGSADGGRGSRSRFEGPAADDARGGEHDTHDRRTPIRFRGQPRACRRRGASRKRILLLFQKPDRGRGHAQRDPVARTGQRAVAVRRRAEDDDLPDSQHDRSPDRGPDPEGRRADPGAVVRFPGIF